MKILKQIWYAVVDICDFADELMKDYVRFMDSIFGVNDKPPRPQKTYRVRNDGTFRSFCERRGYKN